MSKLSGLKSKGKDYEIGGVTFHFTPLGVDELDMLDIDQTLPPKEIYEKVMAVITKVLKDSDPEITDEEVKKYVKLDHMKAFQDAIMDVCGLSTQKRSPIDIIKERQAIAAQATATGQQ